MADGPPLITNTVRRLAGRETAPGERLIAAATILLGLLGIGFLYVSLNAQYRYIFAVKHASAPAMIEAAGLDAGMVIFSLLALGLARAGQPARTERALILACALASAGMNYEAANVASLRSIAAYVMPPVFLAVVVDRVIAVVRRWVVGDAERSAWAVLGRVLLSAGRLAGMALLYVLRLVLDPAATAKGIRRAVLQAAPLPGVAPQTASLTELESIRVSLAQLAELPGTVTCLRDGVSHLTQEVQDIAAGVSGTGPVFATKKEAFLHAYRQHPGYGNRSVAAKVAAELAPAARLQPGTARSYAYEELGRANGGGQ
jgi:hypothetical protein